MAVVVPEQKKHIRYVFIPADVHEDIEERQITIEDGREVEGLLDVMKEHFKRAGGTKTAAQREAQRQALLSQVGADAASKLSEDLMAAALDLQMVETVPLLVNNAASGYVGVNLYCDDQAQVKELPVNVRASQIADCCGRPMQVRGDAFVGRMFDNEDHFVRLDLGLGELGSGAAWVRQAAEQAAARLREGDRAADFMARMQQQQQQGRGQAGRAPSATVRELSPAEAEKEAGNAAFKAGDWAEAVRRYGAALVLQPGLAAARNNRALALLRLGRNAEAEEDCTQVLSSEPRNVKALLRRATARGALGRTAEAAADLQAVLSLEPHNKEAAQQLASMAPPPPPPAAAGAGAPGEEQPAGGEDQQQERDKAPGEGQGQ